MSSAPGALSSSDQEIAALTAEVELRMQEVSRLRHAEDRLVTMIRNARLLRGSLADEDDKWQQVAEIRVARATAREAAVALRGRIRERLACGCGDTSEGAQRSLLNAKRAEEGELIAAIREARVAGIHLEGEDAMWARVGRLREEQVAVREEIRRLCAAKAKGAV
jgi:hypothetical protein